MPNTSPPKFSLGHKVTIHEFVHDKTYFREVILELNDEARYLSDDGHGSIPLRRVQNRLALQKLEPGFPARVLILPNLPAEEDRPIAVAREISFMPIRRAHIGVEFLRLPGHSVLQDDAGKVLRLHAFSSTRIAAKAS